jgi:hypothetical protein
MGYKLARRNRLVELLESTRKHVTFHTKRSTQKHNRVIQKKNSDNSDESNIAGLNGASLYAPIVDRLLFYQPYHVTKAKVQAYCVVKSLWEFCEKHNYWLGFG